MPPRHRQPAKGCAHAQLRAGTAGALARDGSAAGRPGVAPPPARQPRRAAPSSRRGTSWQCRGRFLAPCAGSARPRQRAVRCGPMQREVGRGAVRPGGKLSPWAIARYQVVGPHPCDRRTPVARTGRPSRLEPAMPRPSPTCCRFGPAEGLRAKRQDAKPGHAAATASISSSQAGSKMPVMMTVRATGRSPSTARRTSRFS